MEIFAQLTRLDESQQHKGELTFHLVMGVELLLAHIDPHLSIEVTNPHLLREVLRVNPAMKGFQILDPRRNPDGIAINYNRAHCRLPLSSGHILASRRV